MISRRALLCGAAAIVAVPPIVPNPVPRLGTGLGDSPDFMRWWLAEFREVVAQHIEDLTIFGNSTLKIEGGPLPKLTALGPYFVAPADFEPSPDVTYHFEAHTGSNGILPRVDDPKVWL